MKHKGESMRHIRRTRKNPDLDMTSLNVLNDLTDFFHKKFPKDDL
jgi:hypothetical protein